MTFRHPLLRSAVYHAASGPERRAAHAALAAAWPAGSARWTWHAAGAALGPDATVADALDELADGAHDRGAHVAAARAFRRAAELSPSDADRYRRRLRAANNLHHRRRGRGRRAAARPRPRRGAARGLAVGPRGAAGPAGAAAQQPAVRAARAARRRRAASSEPIRVRAAELILEATIAGMMAGDAAANLEDGRRALELAEGRDEVVATAAEIIYGHGLIGTGRVAEGEARLSAAVERVHRLERVPPSVEGVAQAAHISLWAERYDLAEAILDWLERAVRRAGAAGALGMPLAVRARMELRRGRFVRGAGGGHRGARARRADRPAEPALRRARVGRRDRGAAGPRGGRAPARRGGARARPRAERRRARGLPAAGAGVERARPGPHRAGGRAPRAAATRRSTGSG